MNLEYRFPLFDDLLHGKLDPMKPGNELSSDYEIRLQEQIVAKVNDTGVFRLRFMPALNVKCTWYCRLLISETFLYCEEVLTYLQEQEDYRIRTYLKDTLLDKHLVKCLKLLGDRIRQDHLQFSDQASPEADIEAVTNVYIFQLLKVCITKAYLEIQQSLHDVVMYKQSEQMIYSAYFGDLPPVRIFLTKLVEPEHVTPQKNYPGSETEEQTVSQPTDNIGKDTTPASTEFNTVKEVSKILRVDERTVLRRIEKGEIIAIKKGGKHLIDKKELDIYLKK